MKNYKEILKENAPDSDLKVFEMAIESETLRIENGRLSQRNHPSALEPKISHPYITTDFSESQIELITPVSTEAVFLHDFVNTLYDISALEIEKEESLFPYSMPPKMEESEIRVADFKSKEEAAANANSYRAYLTERYGKKKQTMSGIHFNISLSKELIKSYEKEGYKANDIYLKIVRNYHRFQFLTVALLGASPICDPSFQEEKVKEMVSIRNSPLGYQNLEALPLDYSTTESFIQSLEKLIADKTIIDERELYEPIRLKTKSKKVLEDLKSDEIKYIEIRNVDINPYEKGGISVIQIELLKRIICYCLLKEEDEIFISDGRLLANHVAETADFDLDIPFMKDFTIRQLLESTLEDMLNTFKELNLDSEILSEYLERVKADDFLYKKVSRDIHEMGYAKFFGALSQEHKEDAYKNRFKLYGHEDLELSTQILIKESLKHGIKAEILDRQSNFVQLSKNGHVEYVEQATKTSKDNYVTICAMENKVVTKKILAGKGVRVPAGSSFSSLTDALAYAKKMASAFVIKPKSTNFGLGITIFKGEAKEEEIEEALELAFSHDETVLVEEFISGEEYRFLVIAGELVGVLNRVPANVCGNGKDTIAELIEKKNQDPLRGQGHRTPLEKILIDEQLMLHLKKEERSLEDIPALDELVYLRSNSNVSTGGDSIDVTDIMPERFKEIAVKVVKDMGAEICGLDMIIEDAREAESEYAIIELNFNPAVYLHAFPYKGTERNVSEKILQLLGFVENELS